MKYSIPILLILISLSSLSQTFGPNGPDIVISSGLGNAWTNLDNAKTSDNSYASVSTSGLTQRLETRGYGFNLVNTDVITGIQVDVQRKAETGDDVAIMGTWKDGYNSTLSALPLAAGNSRMLICFVSNENRTEPIISNVTYGGKSMIKQTGFSYFANDFWARYEFWYLMESDLSSMPTGNHDITVTYNAFTKSEFFDIISAAIFKNVDQTDPFYSIQNKGIGTNTETCQFDNPITASAGGMYLTGIFCGQNTSPASTEGGTDTFTINSGFTEGTDIYRSNASATTSGGCMQTAYKIATVAGSENPTITFKGTPNRRLLIGIGLRKFTAVDSEMYLLKNGIPVGTNLANTDPWELTQSYVSYGGPLDLWGTTWTHSDINNVDFGTSLVAKIFNGNIFVDNIRITVYTASVLPVELLSFTASIVNKDKISTRWTTASESNSSHFDIERSRDANSFNKIGTIAASGNSSTLIDYEFLDTNPFSGISYYRLKQVDFNGEFKYSDIVSASVESSRFKVYPNPTNKWLIVDVADVKNTEISIYNELGQVVNPEIQNHFDSGLLINMSEQANGIYYIMKTTNTVTETQKIVKFTSQ